MRAALGPAAGKALREMDVLTYKFQTEFARKYVAIGEQRGKELGRLEGQASLLLTQLANRFGDLPAAARRRIANASPTELEAYAIRTLTAERLDDVFDVPKASPAGRRKNR